MRAPGPRFTRLRDWLAWAEVLHVREIDLSLERARTVLDAMQLPPRRYRVITVAGTNGKGSTVAMLESLLLAAGFRVGCYSSPHLLRYNERVRIAGQPVSDELLCHAFERVDAARAETSITYFEFGTLAAFDIFAHADIDYAVLEVGMGGRLDAVNLVDADVAVVTSIGIDHVEWLGPDRESIGREKAGIFRRGRPAVCSDDAPPHSVLEQAERLQVPLACLGPHYRYGLATDDSWWWESGSVRIEQLPRPALRGAVQLQNAAGVLAALHALGEAEALKAEVLRRGLLEVSLAGRFQLIATAPELILDVAHNPHAALRLAETLKAQPEAPATHAVVGMLRDKDCSGVFEVMAPLVDYWYLVDLDSPRAAGASQLRDALLAVSPAARVEVLPRVGAALDRVIAEASVQDRVLIFGSFLTVSAAMQWQELRQDRPAMGALG
jgi:dihydrofolate synthase / folylpolyglutamate synthase